MKLNTEEITKILKDFGVRVPSKNYLKIRSLHWTTGNDMWPTIRK